ncbi:SDR family NAD(P)-dependent oxidoreductase [Microbispora sp. NEAU-D428]|uniref:SDR family NAD(P)-dependent oxidoreductase n=1 Tax=Microbispora sitophila TaxID=2771537 RepID=UPI001866DC9B|nr:SDR family NAD(P)-dependent oxidoreductase [Microbispora sitophila]MBE3015112.1 SDR family NAD(P)-dependent oxidoreductase [Microbispora sitophila]
MKTWFITGGTPGGFGAAFADAALDHGDRVVLTARRPQELREWAERHGDRTLVLQLDVTDADQVRQAVATAERHFGGIDVLVNNAGRGWYGSIEGMDEAAVRQTFELNFFSVLTVTRAVLPGMRARRSGCIVNISSVAGLVGTLGFGFYTAAKHAVEGLTSVLRQEVEPLGIKVLAVEPGAFRTRAYAHFDGEPITETIEDYRPMLDAVRATMIEQDGKQPGDPIRGARAVVAAVNSEETPRRLVLGGPGYEAVTRELEATLADVRAREQVSRSVDHPATS